MVESVKKWVDIADRILVWHFPTGSREAPAYYLEEDYVPIRVRIHATKKPTAGVLKVNIYDDGISIIEDCELNEDCFTSNTDIDSGNFLANSLDAGSWITCTLGDSGGAANITVNMELKLAE